MKTTITINLDTWQKLKALKKLPGDTMDEIIIRLLAQKEVKK